MDWSSRGSRSQAAGSYGLENEWNLGPVFGAGGLYWAISPDPILLPTILASWAWLSQQNHSSPLRLVIIKISDSSALSKTQPHAALNRRAGSWWPTGQKRGSERK